MLVVGEESFDPCNELAGERELEIDVEQFGGLLVVRFEGAAEHTGPLDSDGSFVVAAITDLSESFGEAELLSRIDGSLEGDAELQAQLRQRLVGEIGTDDITCEALGELQAVRSGPIP